MCLKPREPQPIPPDTKALVGPKLDEDTVYRFVGDVLFEQFHDEDFADLYPKDGQPALSPVLLSFVLIFASLEDLSDRDAAFNVTFNAAWDSVGRWRQPPAFRVRHRFAQTGGCLSRSPTHGG